MRLLLDTHAWVWWTTGNPALSLAAHDAILDESNPVAVSAASAWEVATKERLGKLGDGGRFTREFAGLVDADGFEHLPVTIGHALRAGAFDLDHRDPFDRMLAAQAELESITLVTRDPAFDRFPVDTLW